MSGHLPADAWCRKWTFPIVVLMVLSLVFTVIACGHNPAEKARRAKARSESFWVRIASSGVGRGPVSYTTRAPLELADGSRVVCVSTFDGIWCRDAQ